MIYIKKKGYIIYKMSFNIYLSFLDYSFFYLCLLSLLYFVFFRLRDVPVENEEIFTYIFHLLYYIFCLYYCYIIIVITYIYIYIYI